MAALCAAWCMPQPAAAQSGYDVPDATIPLESLGYEPAPAHILLAEGYTVSSLQYVDAHHLLFTYNKRSLIKRQPDDSPDESPQNVAAILLETPSGKVVAQAEWRLHDHSQYLWPIGEGTFLLRVGRELRLLTPLTASNPAEALQGKRLLTLPGQATMIAVSPDGRMVLVEAAVPVQTADAAPAVAPATSPIGTPLGDQPPAPPEDHTTDVQFLDFDLSRQAQGVVNVNRVGHITAPSPLVMPLTHDGYIHTAEIYPDDWNLIYTQLSGTDTVLGDVVSTCRPGAAFLSNNEMLVDCGDAGQEGAVATHTGRSRHRTEHPHHAGGRAIRREPHPDQWRGFAGSGPERGGGCAHAAHRRDGHPERRAGGERRGRAGGAHGAELLALRRWTASGGAAEGRDRALRPGADTGFSSAEDQTE